MPFPEKLLISNEKLILDLRPHPVALALPTLATVRGTRRDVLAQRQDRPRLAVVAAVRGRVRDLPAAQAGRLAHVELRGHDRPGRSTGRACIAKRSMEIPLEAINDVRFEQGIFDRMVGAGTLVIQSASEAGRQVFDDIRHPEDVQKTIYEQGEANKKRMYHGDAAAPAARRPPHPRAAGRTGDAARGAVHHDRARAPRQAPRRRRPDRRGVPGAEGEDPRPGLSGRPARYDAADDRRRRPHLLLDPRHGPGPRVLHRSRRLPAAAP